MNNVTAYKLGDLDIDLDNLSKISDELTKLKFKPTGQLEFSSCGWDEIEGSYITKVGSLLLLKLKIQEKIMPPSAITTLLSEKIDEIENATNEKVGKKAKKALKDEIIIEQLPKALLKNTYIIGAIDVERSYLLIDSGNTKQAELFVSLLRATLVSLDAIPIYSNEENLFLHFKSWLLDCDHMPEDLTIGDGCKLVLDEEVVIFKCCQLNSNEVLAHVELGLMPVEVSVNYKNLISLTINKSLQLKSIRFNDDSEERSDNIIVNIAADTLLLISFLEYLLSILSDEKQD